MAIIVAKHIHKEYDVGPDYWNPHGTPVFENSHYLWLTDTGFVYGVIQTGKGWVAQMYKVSSKVTKRTNIWRMTATGTRADATSVGPEGLSDPYPTKAALKEAIELIHAEWEATLGMSAEDAVQYVKDQQAEEAQKLQEETPEAVPVSEAAAPTLLKWFWYLAAAVVVAVGIAILAS